MVNSTSTLEECQDELGQELGQILYSLFVCADDLHDYLLEDDRDSPGYEMAKADLDGVNHLIAAINTGCIKQVKKYTPETT